MKILITQEITNKRLADLVCAGITGGCSYWLTTFHWKGGPIAPGWYAEASAYEREDFSVEVIYDDPNEEEDTFTGKRTLTIQDFHTGLQTFAIKAPNSFSEFLQENEDADVGDNFLQCLILGDIIYD